MRVNALLAEYYSGVSTLATFVPLPEELLLRRPAPDSWSASEILQILADSELNWAFGLRTVLTERRPTFPIPDPADWPERLAYAERPVLSAVATISALRRHSVDLLASIRAQQWKRVALHPVNGPMTLRELVILATNEFDEGLARARRAVNGAV